MCKSFINRYKNILLLVWGFLFCIIGIMLMLGSLEELLATLKYGFLIWLALWDFEFISGLFFWAILMRKAFGSKLEKFLSKF